jgi:hypothetical protein
VALTVEPSTLNFGYQELGTTAVQCITVGNPAGEPLTVTGLASFDSAGGAFALSPTDAGSPPGPAPIPVTIPGGTSAPVCFSFTPPITQQYLGQATLATDDPLAISASVQLSGWGGGPQISCTPMSIDFGETLDHSISTLPIICTNTGTSLPGAEASFSLIAVVIGSDVFSAQLDPKSVGGFAPGQSVQIDVSYDPDDAGASPTTLFLELNGTPGAELELELNFPGRSSAYPISPAVLDFGTVPVGGVSAPQTFFIENPTDAGCFVQGLVAPDDFRIASLSLQPDADAGSLLIPARASLAVGIELAPTQVGQIATKLASVALRGRGE